MPALAFGLKGAKPGSGAPKAQQKRTAAAAFSTGNSDDESSSAAPRPSAGAKKSLGPPKPLQPLQDDDGSSEDNADPARPAKSPKLSHPPTKYGLQTKKHATAPNPNGSSQQDRYTNLSALRNAKIHDEQASKLDSTVYDYDGVYDTFQTKASSKTTKNDSSAGPKYMTHLLASTEQRKRDHDRAREKAIQRERENEGDEFADKEKFVTSAYKKQQEENRRAEEEEEKRLEREEAMRKKGVGMLDFNKRMLEREEERMQAIAEAEAEAQGRKNGNAEVGDGKGGVEDGDADDADRKARDLIEKGARIALNEEGEVIDKRQLLSAGLNVAPPKNSGPSTKSQAPATQNALRPGGASKTAVGGSKAAQRERQSRMVEQQMAAMLEQQAAEEAAAEAKQQEVNQSRISEDAKMSAKERYLARKREREEAEKAKKDAK
jgi:coiled-coil domain-containing protein 55